MRVSSYSSDFRVVMWFPVNACHAFTALLGDETIEEEKEEKLAEETIASNSDVIPFIKAEDETKPETNAASTSNDTTVTSVSNSVDRPINHDDMMQIDP